VSGLRLDRGFVNARLPDDGDVVFAQFRRDGFQLAIGFARADLPKLGKRDEALFATERDEVFKDLRGQSGGIARGVNPGNLAVPVFPSATGPVGKGFSDKSIVGMAGYLLEYPE
jgi:hypothetical protein